MRFILPGLTAEFEIPNDWWLESGMSDFQQRRVAYKSPGTREIKITTIEPPVRLTNSQNDFSGFDRKRLVRILKGFVADDEIDPVSLLVLPFASETIQQSPFQYRVLDGMHRFYASIAAGFDYIPAQQLP
jgi:hypothetical protein